MVEASAMGPLPAGRKNDLRRNARFLIEGASPVVYERNLLAFLGIGRENRAQSAVNLSEGGILVRTYDRMKPGTRVKVRLEFTKFNDIIESNGIVRWCFQSAREESTFYTGIRFEKLAAPAASKTAQLRGYFTSPEYRSRSVARKRRAALGVEIPA